MVTPTLLSVSDDTCLKFDLNTSGYFMYLLSAHASISPFVTVKIHRMGGSRYIDLLRLIDFINDLFSAAGSPVIKEHMSFPLTLEMMPHKHTVRFTVLTTVFPSYSYVI